MARRSGGSATADWREPASSDRSQSIGVSLQPAIPRRVAPQQSPLPLHRSPMTVAQSRSGEAIKSAAQASLQGGHHPAFDCDAVALIVSAATVGVISTLRAGCHFYLAPTFEAAAGRSHRSERLTARPRSTSSSNTALAIGERTSSGRVIAVRHTPPASRNFGNSIAVPPELTHRADAVNPDLHAVDVDFNGGEREELFRSRRGYREHGDRDRT